MSASSPSPQERPRKPRVQRLAEHFMVLALAGMVVAVFVKDTREEAAKALADLKGKGMQVNELSAAEANRMREKLVSVNAGIAKSVGQQTWDEVNAAVQQARNAK